MDWEEIAARLERARIAFLADDQKLLIVDASERALTHKFAEHLQDQFRDDGWDVDCEYNRNLAATKRLTWTRSKMPSQDGKPWAVLPDVIVHHRGTTDNLLIIEAKKAGEDDQDDRSKIQAFIGDPDYHYAHGALIQFTTGVQFGVVIGRFVSH